MGSKERNYGRAVTEPAAQLIKYFEGYGAFLRTVFGKKPAARFSRFFAALTALSGGAAAAGIPEEVEAAERDPEALEKAVPACSLLCFTCPGYRGGLIESLAGKLRSALAAYRAENRVSLREKRLFAKCARGLSEYTAPHCDGCRRMGGSGNGYCIEGCGIAGCASSRGVKHCASCAEFPCKTPPSPRFSRDLITRWRIGNEEIRKDGLEAFFRKECSHGHYSDRNGI